MSQTTPDREQFPYRVPVVTDGIHIKSWCNEQIGREHQQWCCGTSDKFWASVEYRFSAREHWELFLKTWE